MFDIKPIKLAFRNFIHDITGQTPKIKEYNDATFKLAMAGDKASDPAEKQRILAAYRTLGENKWVSVPNSTSFANEGFNPYGLFLNNKLDQKIKIGREALEEFGL